MHRLRMIAGPNGSGKTSLTKYLSGELHLNFGCYVNADDIEKLLRENKKFSLHRFGLKVKDLDFRQYYEEHALRPRATVKWEIRRNTLYLIEQLPKNTHFPTLFADYIRRELMRLKVTFSFETVMSDSGKIQLLADAVEAGYRTYLYYVCTEDAEINISRVANRVRKNGHNVYKEMISSRYSKSLNNLLGAIKHSNRAFLIDNSGEEYRLIAEIKEGKEIDLPDPSFIPFWFTKYVLNKKK